ncbi:MAG: hypothetical protein HUK40_17735 [Desulfobacter sp.]|nr:hypothetical protein [Desulfobacter sp.]
MKALRQTQTDTKALTPEEEQVLRVTREPCICIDDHAVHQVLTQDPLAFHSHVHKALIRIANKEVTLEIPPKQIFFDPDTLGDFRVMPCRFQDDNSLVKTVKIVGTNTVQEQVPDQITVGKAFVLDPKENFISHMIDACLLSSARTGICAVQAMVSLGNTLGKLTIIGAGRVGFYTALYAAALGRVKEIVFCDKEDARSCQCVRALEKRYPKLRF